MDKNAKKVNKKYRKRIMIGGALGAVMIATTGVASAHLGNSETREAIKEAFEAKDFIAFKEVAKDTKIAEKIDTEDKFNKLIEAHELREQGSFDEAHAIKEELGLDFRKGRLAKRNPAVREAIEKNDYTAFQEAVNDGKFSEKIDSAEKFASLVQVNELRAEGKYEQARTIMEELGFEKKGHRHGDRDHKKGQEQK